MRGKYTSLDDAVAEIEERARAKEAIEATLTIMARDSRWWSYTNHHNNVNGFNGETEFHRAEDPESGAEYGVHYQKCGGGRRVIHKRIK